MRKISVLILALLVLVILPKWAVGGEQILKGGQFERTVVIIFHKDKGVVARVVDGDTGKDYQIAGKQLNPITHAQEILLILCESSPWHWCVINGRFRRCPD